MNELFIEESFLFGVQPIYFNVINPSNGTLTFQKLPDNKLHVAAAPKDASVDRWIYAESDFRISPQNYKKIIMSFEDIILSDFTQMTTYIGLSVDTRNYIWFEFSDTGIGSVADKSVRAYYNNDGTVQSKKITDKIPSNIPFNVRFEYDVRNGDVLYYFEESVVKIENPSSTNIDGNMKIDFARVRSLENKEKFFSYKKFNLTAI